MKGTATTANLADHLGSTRLVTDLNKNVVQNLDYLLFGELNSTDSGITSHKFIGRVSGFVLANPTIKKERDLETSLDTGVSGFVLGTGNRGQTGRFLTS